MSRNYEKKNHLLFRWNFSANYSHPHQISLKWVQRWYKRIRFLLFDDLSDIFKFQIIFFIFNLLSISQIYSTNSRITENYDLLSLEQRNPVDSRFWSRLCYYCSEWSRPKNNNQLTRNTPSCLAFAVVSKTRLFEQSASASSNYSQSAVNNRDERRTCQKPTIMLFGGAGTHCFARKTSRDYKKEKPSPLLKKCLRQSVSSKSEPAPKKAEMSPNME